MAWLRKYNAVEILLAGWCLSNRTWLVVKIELRSWLHRLLLLRGKSICVAAQQALNPMK